MQRNNRKNILIIEDSRATAFLLKELLVNEGLYNVTHAKTGKEAFDLLNTKSYELVLLDLILPDTNGHSILKIIRKSKSLAELPVIVVSSDNKEKTIQEILEIGANDFIEKPFNKLALKTKVHNLISLQEINSNLTELNKTKDRLFSIIGHDLKNPLNNVIVFAELLGIKAEKFEDKDLSLYQSSIYDSAKLIQQLLDNLLNWARTQHNDLVFNPVYINLYELSMQTSKIYKTMFERKSIQFHNKIKEETRIYADKEMLATILRNLLSNAIKFTNHGGEISIAVSTKKDDVEISVRDSGVGMKEEQMDNLFNPLMNNSTLGTQNERGTGLGLFLCKHFIEKHNGVFKVQSEFGKGTTMSFLLQNNEFNA